jgi:hypothetical protein
VPSITVAALDYTQCCICDRIYTRRGNVENTQAFQRTRVCRGCHGQLLFTLDGNKGPTRSQYQLGRGSNPARAVIRHLYATGVTVDILWVRSVHSLTAFCVTVATSCELVAIVDHDGQGVNSAGARTPHEPLSTLLMRSACTGCAGAITLMSAHWQRVGQRPGPPLNAA